jgi:ApbE superfamily uncharacterized protein (UPF0280 family)
MVPSCVEDNVPISAKYSQDMLLHGGSVSNSAPRGSSVICASSGMQWVSISAGPTATGTRKQGVHCDLLCGRLQNACDLGKEWVGLQKFDSDIVRHLRLEQNLIEGTSRWVKFIC